MSELLIVLCNTPVDVAPGIARALVEERLAACVNLIPNVQSIYFWQDQVVEDAETTLLIKTTSACHATLLERLTGLHPYTVPELVTLEPTHVSAAYEAWALAAVVVK